MDYSTSGGKRLRIYLDDGPGGLYIGNEGFANQIEPIGDSVIAGTNALGDHSYRLGALMDLQVQVEPNHVALYMNGVLKFTARRKEVRPLKLRINPGDGFSEGQIGIVSVYLFPGVPH